MRAFAVLLVSLAGCSSVPEVFEDYRTSETLPLEKFSRTKIPESGINWKMESYLQFADKPEIAHVNFAGRYSIFIVGCGTGCHEYCVIDRATGIVYPKGAYQLDFPNEWDGPMGFQFRPDSRLMTIYRAEGFNWPIYVEYYIWDGSRMNLIKKEEIPKPAGAPEPRMTWGVRPKIELSK